MYIMGAKKFQATPTKQDLGTSHEFFLNFLTSPLSFLYGSPPPPPPDDSTPDFRTIHFPSPRFSQPSTGGAEIKWNGLDNKPDSLSFPENNV